jgi:CheY-like chemotaxis protein
VGASGATWNGESNDLSPLGIKVRDHHVPATSIVRLEFAVPGRGPTLSVMSFAVRNDPDGVAFSFIDLSRPAFGLLREAVDSLLLARPLWVAVVSSDSATANLLGDYVEAQGHAAIILPTGEEAFAYVLHDQPDAILLDLALPGMTGVELLERLARRGLGIPVLAVSATSEAEALRCLELGALDVVGTSPGEEQFRRALEALEWKGLEARLADVDLGLSA